MAKSKANELYQRVERGHIDHYFKKLSNSDFNNLAKSIKDNNITETNTILKNNLKKSFKGFESAIDGGYDAEITEEATRLIQRDATPKRKEIIAELPELAEVITPPPEARLERPVDVTVKGKRHRRTKPQTFTKKELKFFDNRKSKTGGEVFNDYLIAFGNKRTKSSVTTKFYRVRK